MSSLPLILAFTTILSTAVGGFIAFRFKNRIHPVLGFTAGVLLGIVSFDILPEIIEELHVNNIDPIWPMITLVIGFLLFHILEKTILIHHNNEDAYAPHDHIGHSHHSHTHKDIGTLSSLALVGHSFLDGVGIGLGFQVSTEVGIAVAIAVIAHDFADGINTVSVALRHGHNEKSARWFLGLDAIAPVFGALSTLLFVLPPFALVLYLGFFAGFLLYISASDILPEAHRNKNSLSTVVLTVLGVIFIFIVTQIGHGH